MNALAPLGFWAVLMAAVLLGWRVRAWLHERYRTPESIETLRVVMSMMITFSALALGLLTSAAKSGFDAKVRDLTTFGISLIELDQRLHEYGPDAAPARLLLRQYTAAALADTWPGEPAPPGDYPRPGLAPVSGHMESTELGAILLNVDERIALLAPATALQRQLAPVLVSQMGATLQRRWNLVAASGSTVSWPMMAVLLLWLSLAFLLFGLSTRQTRLAVFVLALAALSVSADAYLIIEFDTPLTGPIQLPSAPLRDALAHMDAAPP